MPCDDAALLSDACLAADDDALRTLTGPDLPRILAGLLAAARPGSQLIVLDYPDPFALGAGDQPGPLFTNFDRAGKGQQLTGYSLYRIVRGIRNDAGIAVRPHGLRHAAVTTALERT